MSYRILVVLAALLGILPAPASAQAFTSPRRLALTVEGLSAASPTVTEERKGPRVDAPEKALEGFLRSTGLKKDDLEARDDKKGQSWFATIRRPGRSAEEVIAEAVGKASIAVDGKMVDYAVARVAQTIIARAEAAGDAGRERA